MKNKQLNKTKYTKWGAALLALAFTCHAMAADLTARLNATQVGVDDTFQLTLSTDKPSGQSPDLSALDKDFTVLSTSQSRQVQIINGKTSQSQSWVITLSANKTGKLTIPAIKLGALQSQALTLTVSKDSPAGTGQNAGNIHISADVEAGKHYQFQEIPLTVRVETSAAIQQAELIAPSSPDFELTQSGQDRQSQQTRNGQTVAVIERQYLLRPQKTGQLSLPPFVLRGNLQAPRRRGAFDPFDDFERRFGSPFGGMGRRGEPFVAKSKALTLDVMANPNAGGSQSDWFLPAKAVVLQAEWTPQKPTFTVGEPVTRTIRLQALGARAEQLPKLTFPDVDGVKIYVDNDETAMRDTAQGTLAQREMSVSVVPTRGGEVTLPEIAVKWLNTQTNRQETATLPAQTIRIEGEPATVQMTQVTPANQAPNATKAPTAPTGKAPTDNGKTADAKGKTASANGKNGLIAGAIGVGALVALIVAMMLWRRKTPAKDSETTSVPTASKTIAPVEAVKTAIKSGDNNRIYRTLLDWKNSGVAFSSALNAQLKQLEQHLFGQGNEQQVPIDNTALLHAVQQMEKQQKTEAKTADNTESLPPLYR